MPQIIYGTAATSVAVDDMVDEAVVTQGLVFTFTDALDGGVRKITAHWTDSVIMLNNEYTTIAAGTKVLNSADVVSPTTYYLYCDGSTGLPVISVSTTSPVTNPAVTEYIIGTLIRFKSVGGTLTVYWSKQPNQDGIYKMVHNLKEDSLFFNPSWVDGIAATMAAGGKISTTSGYVRFPGNQPRSTASVSNGLIVLEDESATAVGTDSVTTYADGTAITAGKYVKLLFGIMRDKANYNTAKYMIARQNKPSVEYGTAAAALADSESMAATTFPGSYIGAISPLYYIVTLKGDYTNGGANPAGYLIDIRATGPAKSGGGAAAVSHHALSDLTNYDDHSQYVHIDGSHPLTGNWTAAKNISTVGTLTGDHLISTVATGTAPLTVASTTAVTNLNADTVDGVHGTNVVTADGLTALTGNWSANKQITAPNFVSNVAIGTQPLAVTSTTVCTNLNADTVDAIHGTDLVKKDGTVAMTGALNMGSKSITSADDVGCATVTASGNAKALTFQSTQATGTAPFTVASTTVVTNLNASALQGNAASAFAVTAKGVTNGDSHDHTAGAGAQIAHSGLSGLTSGNDHTQYLLKDGSVALTGNWTTNTKNITTTGALSGNTLVSTVATGTAPLTVSSTTQVANLNAASLNGVADTGFLKADGSIQLTGDMLVTAGKQIDGVDISAHAAAADAHHNHVTVGANTSGILVLSTQDISMTTATTTSQVLAGPIVGATTPAAPTFRALNIQDIARPSGTMTLTNGQNDDVALTAGTRVYIIAGPNNTFGVSGFTGGTDGAVLYIYSPIAKNMTVYSLTGSSSSNQIITNTGANVTSTNACTMMFVYIAGTTNKWVLMSFNV